jgi:hypothetical protein
MLIALAISSIVIAGAIALLNAQERIYRTSAGTRALQESARIALGELSFALRRAGYGVDPGFALDFGATQALQAQAPTLVEGGISVATNPYLCPNPVACRDRIDGPDEIVFYARDPLFGHQLLAVPSANSITLAGPVNNPLYAGQILQLICMTDRMYWVYVEVGSYVPANIGNMPVPLRSSAAFAFPNENGGTLDPSLPVGCFTSGSAWVSKVDRFRYHVQNYDPAGQPVGAFTVGARPYLMLDQGLVTQDNVPIETVIAQDVEDVQFEYLYTLQRPSQALVGGARGTAIAVGAGPDGIDLGAASSGYGIEQGDPRRRTWHPSNIRAVRVSVVIRTPTQDRTIQDAIVPATGNRPDIAGPLGYRRLRFETTVQVPNLDARKPYYPFHSQVAGDHLNVGGS